MPSNPDRPGEVEVAHVLFMDLVEYSRLSMSEQARLASQLQELTRGTGQFRRAEAHGDLIRLPTGDGLALVFFRDPEAPVRCALEVAHAAQAIPQMKLRIGIHSGPVQRVTDINGNTNVSGSGINLAQRVMDCGDPGHILLSEIMAQLLHQLGEWAESLRDLGEFEVKHGQRLHLFNLCRDGLGNRNLPSKLRSPADQPKSAGLKVALLYKRKAEPDERVMHLIEDRLTAAGHDVFIDRHLSIGVDWSKEIASKIRGADAVVPLLSATSIHSDTVVFEVEKAADAARQHGGLPRLLPVRIRYEGELPEPLAKILGSLEYSLWQSSQDDEAVVAGLVKALMEVEAARAASAFRSSATVSQAENRWRPALVMAVVAALLTGLWLGRTKLPFTNRSLPETKQLAVLPFKNVGDNTNNASFSDGLTETITSQLTQLEQFQNTLLVVPMSEVRKEAIDTASQARAVFGATVVLTGSVQRDQASVRVTVNLVDTKTLRILRSATLDNPLAEIYRLQDRVAAETAGWLGLQLSAEMKRVLAAGQTRVASAYELYIKAVGELGRRDLAGKLDFAMAHLQQALLSDPGYARAQAALGEVFWRKYDDTKEIQWLEEAQNSCNEALRLDALLPSAHVTLAVILNGTGKSEKAVEELQHALQLDPPNAEALRELARAYELLNRPADAELAFKKAVDRSPNNWVAYNDLGRFYHKHGRYPDAEKSFLRVAALTPDSYSIYRNLGGLYTLMERYDDAAKVLEKSLLLKRTAKAYSNLGTLYFFQMKFAASAQMFDHAVAAGGANQVVWGNLGDALRFAPGGAAKAAEAYSQAVQLAERDLSVNPNDAEAHASLAVYCMGLNDTNRAFAEITLARQQAPANVNVLFMSVLVHERAGGRDRALAALAEAVQGGYSPAEVRMHPDLESLRSDARFASLASALTPQTKNTKP
jgi:tetratricopeptide (TPR) repeat protein/class 3 adenylate cyclase